MIRALAFLVALAATTHTDAVLCSSFDEDTCSGCTSEGECVWNGRNCGAVADSPNCGDIGITNALCSSLDEASCSGCTSEGECVWHTVSCRAVVDTKNCDENDVVLLDACEDSSSWYVKKENKNCDWVSKNEKRCKKTAKVAASEACPTACDGARRLDACADSSSWQFCVDSASWEYDDGKGCAWVAEKAAEGDDKCDKKDAAGEKAKRACPVACGTCSGDKDCAWVAEKAAEGDDKCDKKDAAGEKAKRACPVACGTCSEDEIGALGDDDAFDSESWYYKKADQGCDWLGAQSAAKIGKLCKKNGKDPADAACAASCGGCGDAGGDEDTPLVGVVWSFGEQAVTVPDGHDLEISWSGGHTVVEFDGAEDFDACADMSGAMGQTSDNAVLISKPAGGGTSYYACGVGSHCSNGMKVAVNWGDGGGGGGGGVCYGWSGLETALDGWPGNEAEVGDINTWDTCMESMENVFNHRQDFNGDISAWDVSAATKLDYAFYHAFKFNGDLGAWDVSSVTSMRMVFWSAKKYEGGDLRGWDVSKVVDMHQMFYFYWDSAFNGDVSTWNVGEVRDMAGMFRNAVDFNADVSSWDTSSAETMWEMFYQAKAFNADVGAWDVSKVTDLSWMFYFALEFNRDLDWSTGSATAMNHMFRGYAWAPSSFNGDISTWDASAATTFAYMFQFATVYDSPMNDWDVSSVQDFSWMFDLASAFNQDISNWDLRSATDINHMFYSASSFRQDLGWCVPNDVFEDSWYDGSNCDWVSSGICGVHFGSRQSDGSISC